MHLEADMLAKSEAQPLVRIALRVKHNPPFGKVPFLGLAQPATGEVHPEHRITCARQGACQSCVSLLLENTASEHLEC